MTCVRAGTGAAKSFAGLDNAKVMIVVLSANANTSRPVMKEVERAFDKGIVVIPVPTEEVEPSEALEFFLSSEHWLDAITPPLEAHIDRLAHTVKEYLIEQGWTGEEGTAASTTAPPATAEPISEENADEIPRTDAVSSATPSGAPEPPLTISRSAHEETASFKEATDKTKEQNAPPPRTQPPAPTSEGAAKAIASPAFRVKTGDANHDAPSRFAPSSGPVHSDAAPVEDAKMEPPAREGSQRESPGERAIPVPPRKEQLPFLQTPKGRGFLQPVLGWPSRRWHSFSC